MKKVWGVPTLEILDVKFTMSQADGMHFDAAYYNNTEQIVDDGDETGADAGGMDLTGLS